MHVNRTLSLRLARPALAALLLLPAVAAAAPPVRLDPLLVDRAQQVIQQGQQTFRFDTFGDEDFWGGTLMLNQAIAGAANGGIGPGVSPRTALAVGLKVDVQALPPSLVQQIRQGKVNLDDPGVTLSLIRMDAVLGIKGFFSGSTLSSMGITCALCHSTVDNSLAFGIGNRLDGLANRDLNVGAIVALAPNLQPFTSLLGVDAATVRTVLNSWGPGKFDAELFLDGKAFNPQQITDGVVTGTNVPGAVLIPNASALAGHNLHTWEGGWGTVTYWNALVAVLEMHGKGNFFDRRLNDAAKFPIAAANGFGQIVLGPDDDLVTSKLPALQIYQLMLPALQPTAGVDFDAAAAARGDGLFSGKAGCGNCHKEPIWTEPGWNDHPAADIGIDAFQANRGPDNTYRTVNLAGIFQRELGLFMAPENKGRFYHDGRFATLADVVNHYNVHFNLGLTDQEKSDLVEYLKSLGDPITPDMTTRGRPGMGPKDFGDRLLEAAPDPVSGLTSLSYRVTRPGMVSLKAFDVSGRLVTSIVDGRMEAGTYQATWNGAAYPTGVYFIRLKTAGDEAARKIVIVN